MQLDKPPCFGILVKINRCQAHRSWGSCVESSISQVRFLLAVKSVKSGGQYGEVTKSQTKVTMGNQRKHEKRAFGDVKKALLSSPGISICTVPGTVSLTYSRISEFRVF